MPRTVRVFLGVILLVVTTRPVAAQVTFETLKTFVGTDGWLPAGPMVQAGDGRIYGLTQRYGLPLAGCASLFRLNPNDPIGTFETLWTGAQNGSPQGDLGCYVGDGGLVEGGDHNLYFTTLDGGYAGGGLIYQVIPNAAITSVHQFLSPSSPPGTLYSPGYGLAKGLDGALYGVAAAGGAEGAGGWFRFGLDSSFTAVASFPATLAGQNNQRSALTVGSDGRLYGTSSNLFYPSFLYCVDPTSGSVEILHEFPASSNVPVGRLLEVPPLADQEGALAFMGVTQGGGNSSPPPIIYRVDVTGGTTAFAQVYVWNSAAFIRAGLVRGSDGTLYGTTSAILGGDGAIYQIGSDGVPAALYQQDELYPFGPVLVSADGNVYGSSQGNGDFSTAQGGGSVFRLTLPGGSKITPVINWPTPGDIVFGTALGSLQLNATADVAGTFSYSPGVGIYLEAGAQHLLSTEFSPTDTAGYSNATATTHINVSPATLHVTPVNQQKVTGAPNPPLTYSIEGFVLDDTVAVVAGAPLLSTTATVASPIGTYPITASLGTLSAANYTFDFGSGTLTVVYAGEGSSCLGQPGHTVLAPINADGTSVFKRNTTVPVKFRVCDANGVSISAAGVVSSFNLVQVITGTASQAVNEAVDSTNPDGAFRWDPTARQWIFNLATRSLSPDKTYVYRITLNDDSIIDFRFGLK